MRLKNQSIAYLTSIIVSFGSFIFGYSLVCISLMKDQIANIFKISEEELDYQITIITTLLPLGALLGTFLMKPFCDRFGEHKGMIILDILAIFGLILQGISLNLWLIYIGRFLVGVYVGVSSGMIPVYLISLSPPEISGITGSFNQLMITVGIAFAYYFGLAVQDFQMNHSLKWTYVMSFPLLICFLRAITLLFYKFDTLERLHKNNDKHALKRYVDIYYDNGSVSQLIFLRKLQNQIDRQKIQSKESFDQVQFKTQSMNQQSVKSFLQKLRTSPVLKLAIVLAIANQLSGINAILFYAKQVFLQISKNNEKTADQYVFTLGILQVIVTFFSGFLINRYGRKTLMITGQILISGALLIGFAADEFLQNSSKFLLMVVFIHIIGFSISLGPVSMIYVAEIMQDVSIVVKVIWVLTLNVALVSQIMITSLGIGKVFLFYGLISTLCLFYIKNHMVESKGLTRQQLLAKLQGNIFIDRLEDQIIRLHEQQPVSI